MLAADRSTIIHIRYNYSIITIIVSKHVHVVYDPPLTHSISISVIKIYLTKLENKQQNKQQNSVYTHKF